MSAAFMVIGVLWYLAMFVIALIVQVFRDAVQIFIVGILMFVPYYVLSSYAALIGLGVREGEKSTLVLVVGGVFLFMHGLTGIAKAQKEAEDKWDFSAMRIINYRYIALIAGVIFYVVAIFNPRLAVNELTIWVYDRMLWFQDTPVIGWILAAAAFLYVLYALFMGVAMLFGLVVVLISSIRNKTVSS